MLICNYKLGFFSETHAYFRPIEWYANANIRHMPNQFDEILCLTWWETLLYNDQSMALITRWCWWWLGCWCSCFPEGWPRAWHGSGVLPVAVFHANSWSYLWEPKIWSPGNPGGIFGRTAQHTSRLSHRTACSFVIKCYNFVHFCNSLKRYDLCFGIFYEKLGNKKSTYLITI